MESLVYHLLECLVLNEASYIQLAIQEYGRSSSSSSLFYILLRSKDNGYSCEELPTLLSILKQHTIILSHEIITNKMNSTTDVLVDSAAETRETPHAAHTFPGTAIGVHCQDFLGAISGISQIVTALVPPPLIDFRFFSSFSDSHVDFVSTLPQSPEESEETIKAEIAESLANLVGNSPELARVLQEDTLVPVSDFPEYILSFFYSEEF